MEDIKNTKDIIEQVALELFSKKRFKAVSIRVICKYVGIKESSVYYHFKNKQAIMDSLLEKIDLLIEKMKSTFNSVFSRISDVPEVAMCDVAVGFMTNYLLNPYVYKMISILTIERMSETHAYKNYQRIVFDLPLLHQEKIFEQMIARGYIKENLPEILAQEYYGIIYFAFQKNCIGCEITDEKMVSTCYGDTHVIISGKEDGMPLILFHGVGDDSALMWIYNAKALSQHFRMYAVDTIGGPGKSIMGKNYNADFDDVIWIDEIIENLGMQKFSFAGVSHGGYLVQLYTLMRSEKVDKAICLSAAVPYGTAGSPMKIMMKIFLPEALFPTKRNVTKLLKKLSGDNCRVFTENALIMEHYTWLLKGFNNMAMAHHKVRSFSDEEIDKIRGRIFYLSGLEDPFEKMGGKEALVNANMNVKFYAGVGHGINHEIAEEVNDMIIKIMEGMVTDLRIL